MKLLFSLSIFILISFKGYSQHCDTIPKQLYSLANSLSTKVNCVDSLGRKQGWWIEYTISKFEYKDEFGKLKVGSAIKYYSYGQYFNNKKVDKWSSYTFEGDQVSVETIDFRRDGAIIVKRIGSVTEYNSDSSIIKSAIFISPNDTAYINCNKKNLRNIKNCRLTYNDEVINTFSSDQFNIEKFKVEINTYKRQIEKIRNSKQK